MLPVLSTIFSMRANFRQEGKLCLQFAHFSFPTFQLKHAVSNFSPQTMFKPIAFCLALSASVSHQVASADAVENPSILDQVRLLTPILSLIDVNRSHEDMAERLLGEELVNADDAEATVALEILDLSEMFAEPEGDEGSRGAHFEVAKGIGLPKRLKFPR